MSKRFLPMLALAALSGCQAPQTTASPPSSDAVAYQVAHQGPAPGHLQQPWDRHKATWYAKHGLVLVPDPDPLATLARLELLPGLPDADWDTLRLQVERLDTPGLRRTVELLQDVDLLALAESRLATGSLLSELPPGDYACTASLWRGGSAGTLVGEARQELALVSGPNTLALSPVAYPTLGLLAVYPASAAPGATVSLQGQGFSVLPELDQVTLGGQAVQVVDAESSRLMVVVPELAPGSYVWWIQVGSGMVGKTGFQVVAP